MEGGSAAPELSRGGDRQHPRVTGTLQVTAVPRGCLTALAAHAHIGWEFLTGAGRQDERGLWWMEDSDSGCHVWGAGRSTDMSHPSHQAGRASFLSTRLIWDWLVSKRKSDGEMQEAVFLQERYLSTCEMRGKINQKDPISMKRELFWRGKGNEEEAQPSETA